MIHFRGGQSRLRGKSEMSGENGYLFEFLSGKHLAQYYCLDRPPTKTKANRPSGVNWINEMLELRPHPKEEHEQILHGC